MNNPSAPTGKETDALGDILLKFGALSEKNLASAREEALEKVESLETILQKEKYVTEELFAQALTAYADTGEENRAASEPKGSLAKAFAVFRERGRKNRILRQARRAENETLRRMRKEKRSEEKRKKKEVIRDDEKDARLRMREEMRAEKKRKAEELRQRREEVKLKKQEA